MQRLSAAGTVRLEPAESGGVDTKSIVQNGLKRRMVDGVEGGTQVEKNESRDLTGVNGTDDVVMNCSDCCFSGVELSVCRLMRWKKMIGLGVCCEALDCKFFNDLGDEAKVGYRSVGFKFERVEVWFLEQWPDYSMFL